MNKLPLQFLIIAAGILILFAIGVRGKQMLRPVAIVLAVASAGMIAFGAMGMWLDAVTRLPAVLGDLGLSQKALRIMIIKHFAGGLTIGSLIALVTFHKPDRWFGSPAAAYPRPK
jgi:hypothetical protein